MLKKYEEWMKNFMESWKMLEGKQTTKLIAKDALYFETPLGKPCESWEEIASLWAVVPQNQKDIEYSFNIICYDEKNAIINWKMTRTLIMNDKNIPQKIDGIFQVSLNCENKCTYFKQWRYTENY